jgi:hypothetical protein
MTYSEYLKDKRVILVGPAPHLVDSNQKEFIESFDVIVRLNVALPVSPDRYKDIGERTDILYNCLSENKEDGGKTNLDLWSKTIKWLGVPYPKWGVFKRQMENFEKKITVSPKKVNYSYIDTQYYIKIENELGCRPNTGFCAMMDLLNYDIKELYVTGITFFKGGYDPSYRGSIDGIKVLDKNHSESLVHKRMNKAGNHRQQPQIDYMKKVFASNNKLKGDAEFEKILTEK